MYKKTKHKRINTFSSKEFAILQQKEEYYSYQEDLAFAKELNILRNDFYYQMIPAEVCSLVDFLYQPLDVISGDAYSARRIDKHRTFYLIVDGMGKGLSASLTTMIMTSFINHIIDKMIEHDSFSLDIIIRESMEYIKPILLDEEALAIDYILFEHHFDKLHYAKFAMPPILLQKRDATILKLKSNNPPLSKWQSEYTISSQNIANVEKFLFYSDGVVENSLKASKKTYNEHIVEDFKSSFTKEEFKQKVFQRITTQEDDLTLIFINKIPLKESLWSSKSFGSSLDSLDEAFEWYEALFKQECSDTKLLSEAGIVFNELFMNAFEHGNLGIDSHTKHTMLEDDSYFDSLLEMQKLCDKRIEVKLYLLHQESSKYIITQITDEGDGFDTQILSHIFRNSRSFNGRGVFVSRKNSMGIYYNPKGNSVLYLNKLS